MSDPVSTPCPQCGIPSSGNFCAGCGSRLAPPACPACDAPTTPGTRYCTRCGSELAGTAVRPPEPRAPWLIAAVLSVVTIAGVAYSATLAGRPATPDMANVGGSTGTAPAADGRAPDISGMTPREQFIRLNDRIMTAAETGDTSTVIGFWPMAAAAYDRLAPGDRDVDARYHMATLHLLVGRIPSTLALADTIMTVAPDHLMGWYLRAIVADFQGDSAAAHTARQAYRRHFDAQVARGLPEYTEHAAQLRAFLDQPTP